jgi:hypothetical protein
LPNIAGLLAGDCREHVEAERGTLHRGFNLAVKPLLEPEDVVSVGHIDLLAAIQIDAAIM